MRVVSFALPVVLVAATDYSRPEYDWAVTPDLTADWYNSHRQPLPEIAAEFTTVQVHKSYIAKLECVGCPFRVRENGVIAETWEQPPRDNSLLLNFTISDEGPALLLNGEPILPMTSRPAALRAFQIPANTSADTLDKIAKYHMLDRSFALGTKYGQFELQYEAAVFPSREPNDIILQFDVTGIHQRSIYNPGSYALKQDEQKMIQFVVHQTVVDGKLVRSMEALEEPVILRQDKAEPPKMACGKLAIMKMEYNPLEWDYYGKFGTMERTWHRLLWGTGEFFDRNGGLLILASLAFGIVSLVRCCIARRERKQVGYVAEDDAEAALLVEHEDAPPEYSDLHEIKVEHVEEDPKEAEV